MRDKGQRLTVRAFAGEIGALIDFYNHDRMHRSIKTTPDAKRAQCQMQRERLDPEFVARALMRRKREGVIQKSGVEFLGVDYFDKAMIGHILEPVEIGWLEQHPEYIEVFHANHRTGKLEWLCRATPASTATKEMAARVYQARKHVTESVLSVDREAKRIADQSRTKIGDAGTAADDQANEAPIPFRRRKRPESAVRRDALDRLAQLENEGVFRNAEA